MSQWIRSAITSATGSRRRNFSAVTSARATPSCEAEDQTRSIPCGPPVAIGLAAARPREHLVQITASGRHERPHAAHSGGAMRPAAI